VRRQGFEPRFSRLRVECFNRYSSRRKEPHRGVEPRSPVWKTGASPQCLQGTVPPAGIEPASPGLQPGALPVELKAHGRKPRSRTGCVLVPGQVGYRLPRSRRWRRPESNRQRRRLQGAPGALPVIPKGRRVPENPVKRTGRGGIAAGQDACLYGAHAMEVSIIEPAMRRAGTAGIEPAQAALETAVLPLNYVPKGK
jgi:hypothetical protein